ncbi:MAG: MMPL family transporter [Candidatus Omnitrophica bacterium]|nr:MMPL family transporter [Candidatus Omnitrophota bacterium]
MDTQDLKYRIARGIIHLRVYIILIFILISLFFLSVVRNIKVETNLKDFLPQRHHFIQVQNKLTEIFGGLNQVSIAIETKKKDIFNKDFLNKVISITEDLYLVDGVNPSRVTSLASRHTKYVRVTKEGFFVERLLREVPRTVRDMEKFKREVIANPNVYVRMVSPDLKSTLIQVDFNSDVSTRYIFKILRDLKRKYEDDYTKIYIAGRPILEGWLNFYLPQMFKILGMSIVVIFIILYLTFRSKRGVILPLLDSSMATLWGIGTMKLLGLRLDPSTILVPFIILSLGISHSVHTMKRYYEEMKIPGMKSKHAIVNTMTHLFLPGLACVLTDGLGFLSLTIIPIFTIRGMALASGLGILANFFTSFMFTPALLSFMHKPKILDIKREEQHLWVDKFLGKLSILSISKKARTITLSIFVFFSIISIFGIKRITVGDSREGSSYLRRKSPYNISESFINSHFGGTNSYYILAQSKNSILKSYKLKAIDSLQNYLLKNTPQAGYANSIVNAVKSLNFFMFAGDRNYYRIPEADRTISEYWFLYSISGFPGDFDYLISRDNRKANIKIDLKDHKASTINLIVANTKKWIEKHKDIKDLKFSYAGGDSGILYAVNDIIKKILIPNVLFITLLIFLYVSFSYRSFVAGWLLLVPLIFSNLIVFSLFGFLRTSITTATLPLAALSEGLGINYGIYIIARMYEEMKNKRASYKNILKKVLTTSGKAVFFSGFIVSLGVLVWVFSNILLQASLGFNLCMALLLNMFTSIIVLPIMVWGIKPKFLFGRVKDRFKKRR